MAELQTLQSKVEHKKVRIDILEPTHNHSTFTQNSVGELKEDLSDLISPYESTHKESETHLEEPENIDLTATNPLLM